MPSNTIGKRELKSLMFPFYTDPELTEKVKKTITPAYEFVAEGPSVPGRVESKVDTPTATSKLSSHPKTNKSRKRSKAVNKKKKKEEKKVEANPKAGAIGPATKKLKQHEPEKVVPLLQLHPSLLSAKAILDRLQIKLPRFLFRGFHDMSGGGHDPRLNSKDGIVPHGFLSNQEPSSIYSIPHLKDMIQRHLTGDRRLNTLFSSWATDLEVAFQFAQVSANMANPSSHIAVLDTSLLDPHVEVHHTVDMQAAALTNISYSFEWLAYGPISGKAFHCVPVKDMAAIGLQSIFGPFEPPYRSTAVKKTTTLEAKAVVKTAKEIGKLFQHGDDTHSDIVLAVIASIMGIYYVRQGKQKCDGEVTDIVASCLSEELKTIRPSQPAAISKGLVNPMTPRYGSVSFGFMIDLLIDLQQRSTQLGKDTHEESDDQGDSRPGGQKSLTGEDEDMVGGRDS
ncbi:hypothetical protein SCAR479_04803 [Seiridium cardinale]|uniref:DUF7587 domain-containing protein n=1 Tax=Seiridium cardinale TaxID=138064 RepID=A0ABR2XXB1_9PEZI